MNIENKKILVVEDEFITAADLIANLEQMGFIVPASTDTGEEVFDLAVMHKPDLILMDINLKGRMTGIEAADNVKKQLDIPVVYLTGQSDEATISKAIESDPFGYIIKPFEERGLKTTIAMALYKHGIDHQLKVSEERYRCIAESSDNLIAILNKDCSLEYINTMGSKILNINSEAIGKKLQEVVNSPQIARMEEHIRSPSQYLEKWSARMIISLPDKEIWVYSTLLPLSSESSSSGQLLWVAKDITEWIQLQEEMQKEGITQLERNMEQFQILNDQIRNPLTIISASASMDEGPSCAIILDAVKSIDNLVTQLDQGWVESNKVRSFLLRHYRHGEYF